MAQYILVSRENSLDSLKPYIVILIAFILFFVTVLSSHQTVYINHDSSSVRTQYIGISTGGPPK